MVEKTILTKYSGQFLANNVGKSGNIMKKTAGFSHAHIQMILQKIPFFRNFHPEERERLANEQDSFVIARPRELIVKKGSEERSFSVSYTNLTLPTNREV